MAQAFSSPAEASHKVLLQSKVAQDEVVSLDCSQRLALVQELDFNALGLEDSFHQLTEFASKLVGCAVSLITVVTDSRQVFLSSNGLGEPWASRGETPLTHSFCQHVVKRNEPLVIHDARNHKLVCQNLAVSELNVIAYLGVPLTYKDGSVLGAFCAIEGKPRQWTDEDQSVLQMLAAMVSDKLTSSIDALHTQRQLEQRCRHFQKMESIGNFAAGIAHDFNSALTGIQLGVDLLEARTDSKEHIISTIGKIQKTIDSAKGIVDQLLNFSRPKDLQIEPVSLAEVVRDALPMLKMFFPSRICIEQELEETPGLIRADKTQIQQVLTNLCCNAEHAMREQGGQLKICVKSVFLESSAAERLDVEAGDYLMLRISDSGHGIPREILDRIHDPFFTTKPPGQGTGLGLWTTFEMVQSQDGRMTVESSPDRGTTIEIFFPSIVPPAIQFVSRSDELSMVVAKAA